MLASQVFNQNFALQVGSVTDQVVVSSAPPQLETEDASGNNTELPLNGRDPDMLLILNAGTTWTGSIQWERPTNRARGWKLQSNFNSKTEA
jgi:hypothetical protein